MLEISQFPAAWPMAVMRALVHRGVHPRGTRHPPLPPYRYRTRRTEAQIHRRPQEVERPLHAERPRALGIRSRRGRSALAPLRSRPQARARGRCGRPLLPRSRAGRSVRAPPCRRRSGLRQAFSPRSRSPRRAFVPSCSNAGMTLRDAPRQSGTSTPPEFSTPKATFNSASAVPAPSPTASSIPGRKTPCIDWSSRRSSKPAPRATSFGTPSPILGRTSCPTSSRI